MLWKRKEKKNKAPKGGSLFREAFLPSKKNDVPVKPVRRSTPVVFPGVALLWLALFVTTGYALFISPFHSIGSVSVSGSADIPGDRIEEFLRERMKGTFFRIFPKSNFFLFSSDRAQRDLLEAFPKLKTADIRKEFPNRLSVSVSERNRIPLWCSQGLCFLLDDGIAREGRFAEQSENESFLFRIEDTSSQAVSAGGRVLDDDTLARVLRIERMFRESGVVDIMPRTASPSRVSEEFRFTTLEGWDILVSTEPDPETTMETLRIVLEKELPDGKRTKLRYIDLRTEKKVFYAFTPDESPEGDSENEKMDEGKE